MQQREHRMTVSYPAQALYDLVNDPLELNSLDEDPAQEMRKASMKARLLQLRPLWPDDSDAASEEPDDDE